MTIEHSDALEHARVHRLVKRQVRGALSLVQSLAAGGGGASTDAQTSAAADVGTATSAQQPEQQTTAATSAQEVIQTTSRLAPTSSETTAAPVQTSSSTTTTTTSSTTTTPTTSSTTTAPSSTSEAPFSTQTTTTSAAESSSTSSTTTTAATLSSLVTSQVPSTTVVIVSGSASSASSSALPSASKASGSGGSSSIKTGSVVGIVAGAVVGIIAIVGIAVWFFKKKWQREDHEDQVSPFDREEFRRASVMLDDVDEQYAHSLTSYHGGAGGPPGGHSPQMSEYSMHDMPSGGLGRSNTLLSNGSTGGGGAVLAGLARGNTLVSPRPPTMIGAHYAHHQQHQHQGYGAMPSFAPGQVIPSPSHQAAYGAAPPMDLYGATGGAGPYAAAAAGGLAPMYAGAGAAGLDRSLTSANAGAWRGADLSRNNSQASAYSQASDAHQGQGQVPAQGYVPAALRPGGSAHGHGNGYGGYPDERPLSLVDEADEPYSPARGAFPPHAHAPIPEQSRSGTPTDANPQQTFYAHHGREESLDAFRPRGGPAAREQRGVVGQAWSDEDVHALARGVADGGEKRERRLSVRNGGLDAFDDEDEDAAGAYAGLH